MTSLVESCQISPPTPTPLATSLPLTFFDIPWLLFHPIRRLVFFDFPCSKSDFLQTHLPKLKQSLSLTLKHFSPLAGNIVYSPTTKPEIRYLPGDSISLALYESVTHDFDKIVRYSPRDADLFHDFVPLLPPITDENNDFKIIPLLAIQLTLFPGRGLCIGFSNHHSAGDARSVVSFIKAWASCFKLGELIVQETYTPCFDRKFILDPKGLDTVFWNQIKSWVILKSSDSKPLPTGRVRATYVLNESDIKKLKDFVLTRRPGIAHLSSFVVAAAFVWTVAVKSDDEEIDENVDEYFIFTADIRARLEPKVPADYFGNCLSYGLVKIRHSDLVGDEGFVLAAEAFAESIRNRVNNKEKVLEGAENWVSDMKKFAALRMIGVSGSPKFDFYDVDFGWGKARKCEVVSIDEDKCSISMSKLRDSVGGLEIGWSLPKDRMGALADLFAGELSKFE